MTTTYTPLSFLSASHADRTSVLMHFMVEDFADFDWNLAPWQARPQRRDAAGSAHSGVGPALDEPMRRRLHGLAGLLEMSLCEADRWYADYWLVYTVLSAYARPCHANGWSFVQMVTRIDGLTQRARTLLPRTQVPGFECQQVTADGLVIRLREERPRAAAFLRGLLRRLAADFGVNITLSEHPELGASAVRLAVVHETAELPVRAEESVPPVRRLRPASVLSAPQRQNSLPLMTA